jgi:hypothetical protein
MTRREQRAFVRELIENVQKGMLDDIRRVPENWDDHELRQWVADRFERSTMMDAAHNGQRLKEYRNTVLVCNL